ncbi:hypothetical protein ACXYX3_01985 [Mycobacterium sp. C3-094]
MRDHNDIGGHMGWEKYVGRVGALAVALGIGSAVASLPGVAWADSDGATSAGGSAPATSQTTERPAAKLTKPKVAREDRPARKRVFGAHRASADATEAAPSSGEPESDLKPAVDEQEPVKKAVRSLFQPRAATEHKNDPESPAAAPLLLTMLATARQHAEERRADRAAAAATSSAVQASPAVEADADPAGIPGGSRGPVVIGSTGTVYQVTHDTDGTRVSIIDIDGHVITTSQAIPGMQDPSTRSVTRPDGSLVVVTMNDRQTRSTLWSVNSQGEVSKITTVVGIASTPRVAADGSLYFSTNIPFIFSPIGNIDYRTVRISPTNRAQTFAPNSTVTLAPDGSAYLVSTQFGGRTLHAFGADGKTKTILLPREDRARSPILGEDGYVYLPVGVTTLFGGKTTRLYTFHGAQSTTRTVTGLPGNVVVKNDGLYLETFTYPGNKDVGDGTTFIYKITPTAIADPRVIEARLRSFTVTAEGTIYAVVRDSATTPVVVISPDGTSQSTVVLPGTALSVTAFNRIVGAGEQTDDHGYVTYTANGTNYLAVLNSDGTVDRTIELPEGSVPGQVFFGPDGAAYQINQLGEPGAVATTQILLTLSNDSLSPPVRGPLLGGAANVQFAPDGSGYLLLRNDPQIGAQFVGFDAAGLTGVTLTLTQPVGTDYGPEQFMVFGPDGTGYVASNAPGDAGVYAFTTTGVTKVLDLDGTPPVEPPVVGPDGTVYVTTGTADGFTVVRTIAPSV